jgi:transposase-like protein
MRLARCDDNGDTHRVGGEGADRDGELRARSFGAEVARRHDVTANMVFTWRRQAGDGAADGQASAPAPVPMTVVPEAPAWSNTADDAQSTARP